MSKYGFRTIFSGMSRQVLLWLLLMSLAPMSIVGFLSFDTAKNSLCENAFESLSANVEERAAFIENWFTYRLIDLESLAGSAKNVGLLGELRSAFMASGQTLGHFVKSAQWNMIARGQTEDLVRFRSLYGYHDIFLIDIDGNILYSLASENDLGTNLYHGQLAGTQFAAITRKSIKTGAPGFSDLEHYSPSADAVSGFLTSPLLNKEGKTIGVLALQITPEQVGHAMRNTANATIAPLTYVVGYSDTRDGATVRVSSPRNKGGLFRDGREDQDSTKDYLNFPVDTEQTRRWLERRNWDGISAKRTQERGFVYDGPNGERAIGVSRDISVANVRWGLIAEIPEREAFAPIDYLKNLIVSLGLTTGLLVVVISIVLTRHLVRPIVEISAALAVVGEGDFRQQLDIKAGHELGALVRGFNDMIRNLGRSDRELKARRWIEDGVSQVKDKTHGGQTLAELAANTIGFLCRYLNARVGAFYAVKGQKIELMGSYALPTDDGARREFNMGESLIGQAALDGHPIVLDDLPEDYPAISSGLGETPPKVIVVDPLVWGGKVVALLEFGALTPFGEQHARLIDMVAPTIAIAVLTSLSRDRTQELLERTQAQAEELQAREEELRDSNQLLERQAGDLRLSKSILADNQAQLEQSNQRLQAQQEELRVSNEELEQKARDLMDSRSTVEKKNQALEQATVELELRAEQLTVSSKYKSEFLANMSHELRTPLNSLLILAKLLTDNQSGNLTQDQVEYSRTIHDAGAELLALINDILDLSKIEAGKMEIYMEPVNLIEFVQRLERKFAPLAANRGIKLEFQTDEAPKEWRSDGQKLHQIVKNLLSNAVKFTNHGQVTLRIAPGHRNIPASSPGLPVETMLAISVTDSGIGIAADRRQVIFEAFQQADGSTSRKYGGTGLGLSISRELAKVLGGDLEVESMPGKGSTFTLHIPSSLATTAPDKDKDSRHDPSSREKSATAASIAADSGQLPSPEISMRTGAPNPSLTTHHTVQTARRSGVPDDRNQLNPQERSILIIENDARLATMLAGVARGRGFKVLVAEDGETGLHFADYYEPSGILLDAGLPGMDGWQVLERLKDSSKTRHIPVHFMSAEDNPLNALKYGAVGFLAKPFSMTDTQQAFARIERMADRPVKRLLLIEDNPVQRKSISELIGNGDVETVTAATADDAVALLSSDDFDCIVLDLGLPGTSGLNLLETLRTRSDLRQVPVVVYTGKELEPKERDTLNRYAQSVIIKDVRSPERLLDDTALFLHRVESKLPDERRRMIRMLHDTEVVFEGRKVLLVDDDMRNIFALSAALQEKQVQVLVARNGREALKVLDKNLDTSIVLMDIMMPEMDGYEAMTRIRKQTRFADLPIIALTAKAMKGDRALCIKAGANDYVAKPVDTGKLLSLMRVWMYR